MIRLMSACLLALLLTSCGNASDDCADDPTCRPSSTCGPFGCSGGGLAGNGGGGAGGFGGIGGGGGLGGSGGGEKPATAATCAEACRHVYFDCAGWFPDDGGGIVPGGSCPDHCTQNFTEEQAACAAVAACNAYLGCIM